jgi:single-stranded-DNA-specific exonuclease
VNRRANQSPATGFKISPQHPGAESLAREAAMPLVIAQLLCVRQILTADAANQFFSPAIDHLHDPFVMLGMRVAVERIESAIAQREPILIYGDYDVDGTVAIVLLKTAIERCGGTVRYHVPHRIRDGYGMQAETLRHAAADGVRLVISVDTGIRAFAAAQEAETLNLDLIVTDHHLPEASLGLPRALAVLNPHQDGCAYPCKYLCGAGVAFKLAQALLEADLSQREVTRTKVLPSFLKMLAIATIADAVPLLGENRTFVAIGLRELARPAHSGLRALMQLAQLDPAKGPFNTQDIGFRLAPRINAAGRMDIASDVVELFTTRDPAQARLLAEKLDRLNSDRRATEQAALTAIEERLASDPELRDAACIVIDGDGWHRGVIGILASRIVDRTGKPALVIAHEDGEAYGSGRSADGFHLLDAISTCHALFTRYGGHAHAVGFSLPSELVPQLRQQLAAHAATFATTVLADFECDAALPLDEISSALWDWLRRFEPLGMENAAPIFHACGVTLTAVPRYMKDVHVRLRLTQKPGAPAYNAVGWNMAKCVRDLGLTEGSRIDIAYTLRENQHPDFGGLELELMALRTSA